MNQGTILGRPVVKWIALAALVAVLVALLPGGLLQAQGGTTIEYMENGTAPVLTLSASDPETGNTVDWSLPTTAPDTLPSGFVAGDFNLIDVDDLSISDSGVLSFDMPPNYEAPGGGGPNGMSNTYKVVVQASDGSIPGYFKVTVNVLDEEEEGSVELQPTAQPAATLLQPQVGVGITAHRVTDPDGTSTNPASDSMTATGWQWYRSSSKTATGTAIPTTGIEEAYIPVAADVGNHLRVVATYNDRRGNGKTAAAVSEYMTIARIASNTAPEFSATSTARAVLEGTDAGTSIGNPVTATDADVVEELTYWLDVDDPDAALFKIDAMTGQLKVETKLNYEGTTAGSDQCAIANACAVTVNAGDSSGSATDTIDVTISVIAVDEKPTFSAGPTTITRDEGPLPGSFSESDATYTASDPERGSVTLSLSGADASKFELSVPVASVTLPDYSKVLGFKDNPDFDMPGDSNRDNVYQVTVVASDGVNSAMRDVIVKVTDMEELGEIEVAPSQPRVGTALTATLTDPDGVISSSTTWKWRKVMPTNNDADACSVIAPAVWTPDSDTTLIKDAESATYTPVSDDDGYCLRVEASYLDMNYVAGSFVKSVVFVLAGKVQGPSTNVAPMFDDTRAMRYVPEDAVTMAADNVVTNVGMPITAKDSDKLIYTLSGADAGLFTIEPDDANTPNVDESVGQIQVKEGAMLDHETKPTLTVTLTATDPHQATDTITVTIKVTDVDEAPMAVGSDDRSFEYTEDDTVSVVTLSARDPENAAPIVWSLAEAATDLVGVIEADVADHGSFNISQGGVLTFKMSPSFEGESASGDDSYKVVVQASDGNMSSYFKVTVNVLDEEEEGSVELQPTAQSAATLLQPQVGVGITAHSLTDPDGLASPPNTGWQWYRSSSKTATGTAIPTTGIEEAYIPVAADVGRYLRVVATYDDRRGNDKTAAAVSEYQTISEITVNADPEFSATSTTRVVLEGTDAGTSIGNPVTATDADVVEELTYWLDVDDPDAALFKIDAMTGQLKVETKLNYEGTTAGSDQCAIANACAVTVNAGDSSGSDTDTIDVTISVIAVDEKPTFSAGPTTITRDEGPLPGSFSESDATYTASDPERGSVTLSLSGADASKFELSVPVASVTLPDYSKVLGFKDKPDFEMPGDSNRDNVYQVTVVASDGVNSAMRDVIVKVTDMEEPGRLRLRRRSRA